MIESRVSHTGYMFGHEWESVRKGQWIYGPVHRDNVNVTAPVYVRVTYEVISEPEPVTIEEALEWINQHNVMPPRDWNKHGHELLQRAREAGQL